MGKIVFVHGPSGGGKGVFVNEATKIYENQEYRVTSRATGDMFREAKNQAVKETMEGGRFVNNLDLIIPKFKDAYREYLLNEKANEGKAVLFLDGFIRLSEMGEGEARVPSQIEQIAKAILEVRKESGEEQDLTLEMVVQELRDADHVLIDVAPEDAVAQIEIRAKGEIAKIRDQMFKLWQLSLLPLERYCFATVLTNKIQDWIEEGGDAEEIKRIASEVAELKKEMAREFGLNGENVFADFYAEIGVKTSIREDDFSQQSREGRVWKYVNMEGKPGEAGEALSKDVGYRFNEETRRFESQGPNQIVISNGKSRNVGLQAFCDSCKQVVLSRLEGARGTIEGDSPANDPSKK